MIHSGETLYISDLDGTLLNDKAELSQYTKTALNRMIAEGLCFTIATARTPATACRILEDVEWRLPLVLLNGAVVFDNASEQYVQILPIEPDAVAAIIDVLKQMQVSGIMYQFKDNIQRSYYETLDHKPIRDFIETRIARYNKSFRQTGSFSAVAADNNTYFTLLDSYEIIVSVRDALASIPGIYRSIYKDNYSDNLWFLEIHSEKATKKNAVNYLKEAYGFERAVGFGDNLNDLPMFEACDVKVAVENAFPEIKAAANQTCGGNNEDGVVRWLEEVSSRSCSP